MFLGLFSNRLIILTIFTLKILACATASTMKQNYPHKTLTELVHEEPEKQKKAIVILLHGLNLKPQRMDDWAKVLVNHGAHVIRFALYGHSGDRAHMANVTAEMWRSQFDEALNAAKKISGLHNI